MVPGVGYGACLFGPAALAIFCSLALVPMLWRSQTGTVDSGLSAKAEFEPHASFSLVANLSVCQLGLPLPSPTLMGLHFRGQELTRQRVWEHRSNTREKGHGCSFCSSLGGCHKLLTTEQLEITCTNKSLPPGFSKSSLSPVSVNSASGRHL